MVNNLVFRVRKRENLINGFIAYEVVKWKEGKPFPQNYIHMVKGCPIKGHYLVMGYPSLQILSIYHNTKNIDRKMYYYAKKSAKKQKERSEKQ